MGGQSQDNKSVTEDHCEQAMLRVEGKVDLNTEALDRLANKLEPKLEMIVRIDSSFKWVKGIVLFIFSAGIFAGAYKAVVYFQSLTKK